MKTGIGLFILGIGLMSVVFLYGERISDNFSIEPSESAETEMYFEGNDIAYYKIYIPEFSGKGVFVQIFDQNHNIILDGKVETKMSVGYFEFEESGTYFIKITNLSKDQINFDLEFGDTKSKDLIIPGIITLVGCLMMIISLYFRLRDYKIAQPEENIS